MYGTVRPRGVLCYAAGDRSRSAAEDAVGECKSLKTLLAQTMIILRVVLRHHHPGCTPIQSR